MTWILLILFVVSLILSFGSRAKQTDKPSGMILTLLLALLAGTYTAKAGIDVTAHIIINTAANGAKEVAESELGKSFPAVLFKLPPLWLTIVRAVIGIPLTTTAIVVIIRNQFTVGEQTIPEAVGRRFKLSVISSAAMLVTFIASIVMIFPHLTELLAVGIIIAYLTVIFLALTIICPFFLLMLCAVAGVGVASFLQLMALPIILYFAASAFYLVSAACGVSFAVKGIQLAGLKKRYMIPFILLALVPGANNVVYFALPGFVGKKK